MIHLRRSRLAAAALVLLAPMLSSCADSPQARPDPPGPVPYTPAPGSLDVREDGWVWESYRDLEVAVPPGWSHGTGDVAAEQWCISDSTYSVPFVVRPGNPAEAPCPSPTPGAVDPATQLARGGTFVSFARAAAFPDVVLGDAGDRTTAVVGSVLLRVQADPETRGKILASARQISTDVVGCPTNDPISTDPYRRPQPAQRLSDLREVTRIVACRYVLAASPTDGPTAAPSAGTATLYSSLDVTGQSAADAVRAMADAKDGGGPNDAPNCPSPEGVGTEAIVLRVTSAAGLTLVYLRYGGCNGIDDGTGYRALTRTAIAPFVSGPNSVAEFGESLGGILDDPDAPATSGDPGE
ncbi:MAG: hypothetical protein ACT4QF_18630 [Sporichthyaceae bacterium]